MFLGFSGSQINNEFYFWEIKKSRDEQFIRIDWITKVLVVEEGQRLESQYLDLEIVISWNNGGRPEKSEIFRSQRQNCSEGASFHLSYKPRVSSLFYDVAESWIRSRSMDADSRYFSAQKSRR